MMNVILKILVTLSSKKFFYTKTIIYYQAADQQKFEEILMNFSSVYDHFYTTIIFFCTNKHGAENYSVIYWIFAEIK